jgi:DNA replication and repair protein RecF
VHLQKLQLTDFKSHGEACLEFSSGVNCFLGDNGSGKTNILDAIHYLGNCKSFFNPIDSQNIRHGAEFMVIDGTFSLPDAALDGGDGAADDILDRVVCAVKRGQKKSFKRNEKQYAKLADHIGRYPVVMIAPSDAELIQGGSEVRRRLMDQIISTFDRPYLDRLMDYNRLLLQRNNLLRYFAENRKWDAAQIAPWNDRMVPLAQHIHQARKDFVSGFVGTFDGLHRELCGGREQVALEYSSSLFDGDFAGQLEAATSKDRHLRRTTVGIHKDELSCTLSGHPIKRFGSQGQQKTFLLALRLAQVAYLERAVGRPPILLLDDIFDKIDQHRAGALMAHVSNSAFSQVILTDTALGRIPALLSEAGIVPRVFEITPEGIVQHEAQPV